MKARVSVSDTRACYVGPGLRLAPHRNSVATVAMALDGHFELQTQDSSTQRKIALIGPGTRHHLVSRGPMLFLYLDALSDDYQSIQKIELENFQFSIPTGPVCPDKLLVDVGISPTVANVSLFADSVRRLRRSPQSFNSIESLAELAGLSVSRFQVIFRQQMGIPFRRYRLWCKLRIVANHLALGHSLTEAALESGFSSSAHLSSTFKEMFGLAPSALLKVGVRFSTPVTP